MPIRSAVTLFAVVALLAFPFEAAAEAEAQRTAGAARFAGEIDAFVKRDAREPPASGAILFTGSSSIRTWKTLARDMEPLRIINRGFGGSHLAHVDYYADQIVMPYAPRAIVLYAGDNDLSGTAPKTPKQVLADLRLFVSRVHDVYPETRIYFLSIKPSIQRWARWPSMERANALAQGFAARTPLVRYVDVATPMLGPDGRVDRRLFMKDGLHLNPRGYALWTSILKPILLRESPEPGAN